MLGNGVLDDRSSDEEGPEHAGQEAFVGDSGDMRQA
jgi:hypothetical protein